jgi:hypothetical protein
LKSYLNRTSIKAIDTRALASEWENGMGYYAAFVLDPDGNNIEAAFREE